MSKGHMYQYMFMQFFYTCNLSEISTKILGLDICADTLVGDEMRKGISGGQMKRLTTGSHLYYPPNMACFLFSYLISFIFPVFFISKSHVFTSYSH